VVNMNGNVCRDVRQEIDQSELRESLSAGSEAHVGACAACATFRDERLRLRELVGGLQPVAAPADFEMRLRARIARERDLPRQPFIFRFVMSTPAIVVAAVLVIAVGAIVFLSQMNRSQDSTLAKDKGNESVKSTPKPIEVAKDQNPEPGPSNPAGSDAANKPKQSPMIAKNKPKSNFPATGGSQVEDFGVRAAQPVRMIDRAGEVSLTAPLNPMVVTMYDERGGTRKIQLPPISFGSQRLTNNRSQVSMTNTKDW
jgi:hypothetical protein